MICRTGEQHLDSAHTWKETSRVRDTDRWTDRQTNRDMGSRCRRQKETQGVTDVDREKEGGMEEGGELLGL